MRLKITLLILCTVLFNSNAQTTLQTQNLPVIGDLWSNTQILDTTIQPGAGGMGQIWNFGAYAINPTVISEQYAAPTGTGNDALFPTANLKVNSYFGGFDYFIKTANELQYLGSKDNTYEILLTSVEKVMSVPFAYGDSITNVPVTGTSLGYQLTGTISVKADGAGDLTLFSNSFTNTLRVFTKIDLVMGAGSGLDTYITLKKYAWYSSLYRAPVFVISSLDADGVLATSHQKFTTVSTLTTDVPAIDNDVFGFNVNPNPAHQYANLSLNLKSSASVEIQVMDITGRTWKSWSMDLHQGNQSVRLDISTLPKGLYLLSVSSGNLSRKQRLMVD